MISNITMTIPSNQGTAIGFGMPRGGQHAIGTPVTGMWSVDLPIRVVDRARCATKGQVTLVAASVSGTNAWSPPLC